MKKKGFCAQDGRSLGSESAVQDLTLSLRRRSPRSVFPASCSSGHAARRLSRHWSVAPPSAETQVW